MPNPEDLLSYKQKADYAGQRAQMTVDQQLEKLKAIRAQVVAKSKELSVESNKRDMVQKAQEKKAKEAQAAKEKAKGQKGEAATSNLPEITNQQTGSGAAGVQGGGDAKGLVDSFATGPEGPQSQLPGVPGAPPFLTDTTRTSEVGPRDLGLGITMPMRTTRQSTSVKLNQLTAAQAQQLEQSRRESVMEQARWKQEQQTKSQDKIFTHIAGADQATFDAVIDARPEWAGRLIIERSDIDAKRRLKGTVNVMMQNPETGKLEARTIPKSELPSGGAPTFIKPTASTTVNVSTASPDLSKKTVGIIEEDMYGNIEQLDRFNRIANSFNPSWLNAAKMKQIDATAFIERKTGSIPNLPGFASQEEIIAFREFKSVVDLDISLYIKKITGAQMSIQERQYLKETRPNMDMSPSEFVGAFNAVTPMIAASLARQHLIRKDGFGDEMIQKAIARSEGDTEKLFKVITFDVVRSKMAERMAYHRDKIISGEASKDLRDEQIDQLAKSRVAEEFGMEGVGSGVR